MTYSEACDELQSIKCAEGCGQRRPLPSTVGGNGRQLKSFHCVDSDRSWHCFWWCPTDPLAWAQAAALDSVFGVVRPGFSRKETDRVVRATSVVWPAGVLRPAPGALMPRLRPDMYRRGRCMRRSVRRGSQKANAGRNPGSERQEKQNGDDHIYTLGPTMCREQRFWAQADLGSGRKLFPLIPGLVSH